MSQFEPVNRNQLKIGMVTACYKPVVNGVTHMVSMYRRQFEQSGHDITIFTLGKPDPAGDEPGVLRSPGIPLGESGYYLGFGYRQEMRRQLAEMDILHCHHLMMSLELAHRYGRSPIIYTNHTRYDLYTGAYTPLPQPTADALMRQIWPELTDLCDVVIAPSASVAGVLEQFGVRRPIRVVPNGIDMEPFRAAKGNITREDLGLPPDAWPVLIYTGRLAAEKNLDKLLDQFAVVQERLPLAKLLLVGDGPQRASLEKHAARAGLSKDVIFTGKVPFESVPCYLWLADIFVTLSRSEVHPLTVIEAMAAGLPTVALHSPGIADTIESGKTGVLTRLPEGVAAAVVELALDPPRLADMGRRAKAASQQFDIKRTVAQRWTYTRSNSTSGIRNRAGTTMVN